MSHLTTLLAAASICLSTTGAMAESPHHEAAGQTVAHRNCGGCHAVAQGDSPLAAAPPFRLLHQRYPVGGLDQILAQGMIAPPKPWEEAMPTYHPSMPMADLGVDEVANLKAYLRSLDPRSPTQAR